MIYTTISKSDFKDAFQIMGRKEQFSYEGLCVLYDYLEEVYTNNKESYELDVIALCCDFSEYTLDEVRTDEQLMKYLNDHTTVLRVDDTTVIIGAF